MVDQTRSPVAPPALGPPPDSFWLFGPGVDLWVGCGLAYLLALPLLLFVTQTTGVQAWPFAWIGILGIVINSPHYGATLVRVYEQRAVRRRYVFFTVYVTLALIAAFLGGLSNPWIGSLLITLFVSWSPWHFAGQNYGLAVMFLRRGGVEMPPLAKRMLHASFLLAFLLALLAMHVESSSAVYAPGAASLTESYRMLRIGVPSALAQWILAVLAPAYLVCVAGSIILLRRAASWRTLVPVGLLILTHSLWFVIPAVFQLGREIPIQALPFSAIWISTAHSAQYLWVSAYYAKRSGNHNDPVPFLTKSLMAGTAVGVVPGLLFMPELLGSVTWSAGLGSLLFAVINLHHFILDGAIWKLRDGPVARVLIRSEDSTPIEATGSSWLAKTIWALGAACLVVPLVQTWELSAGMWHREDADRIEQATRRLALVGRSSPMAWVGLGAAHEHAGDIDAAAEAYRETLELVGDHPRAMNRLAWVLAVYHGEDPGAVEEAVGLAERATLVTQQRNPHYLDTLAVAQAAQGHFDLALRTADHALSIARRRGMDGLVRDIQRRIALYRAGRPFAREPGG